MGRPRRRNNKSHKREIYGQIGIPIEPRDNEITIITNAISICIPTTDHVPSKIQVNIGNGNIHHFAMFQLPRAVH